MFIYPAIDLYEGKAVRLYKGDYDKMTVYSFNPVTVAEIFKSEGAERIHIVDLEGAKNGNTPNFEIIRKIKEKTGLFCQVGGGIRDMDTVRRYISAGLDRVILGTAAVTDEEFLRLAVNTYGGAVAVGADIKDGFAAIKGWTEKSELEAFDFIKKLADIGVSAVICTDISKDGAMTGTNMELYRELSQKFNMDIIASGGVSSLEDIKKLAALRVHGAIIGKAYYTGTVSLKEACEAAR